MTRPAFGWIAPAVAIALAGCASMGGNDFDWAGEGRPQAGKALQVLWMERLTSEHEGPFIPVERASPALDPGRDRVFIGATDGALRAFTSAGRELWRYDAEASIDAAPAFDREANELYLAAEDGSLHALRGSSGALRWKDGAGDAVRQPPVLSEDAVYVVTEADRVLAFARKDGALLWEHARDIPEGFSITSRAGLLLTDDMLVTGFTDGAVVALDPTDGRVLWERDTSLDLEDSAGSQPTFRDVDTTPVLVDGRLYVASFSGGMYALDPANGTVRWRDEKLTGVVGLAASGDRLLLASADRGLVCLTIPDHVPRWTRPVRRGSPTTPIIIRGLALVGASEGSLIALSLLSGQEVGRVEAGNGFTAQPAAAGGRGFVLSNGGSFFAFAL